MTLQDNCVNGTPIEEMLPEDYCITHEHDKHYIWLDWFAEDPEPDEPEFNTEYGPCPKNIALFDNTQCIRTDFSIISLS